MAISQLKSTEVLASLQYGGNEQASLVVALMQSRRTILPKRLIAPGPNHMQLQSLLEAAACAPDHKQLLPWRFVMVEEADRARLGDVFAAALHQRDPLATPEEMAQAREKAFRAPLLLLLIVDGACGDTGVDLHERTISAGCALQNVLLMATALGFGSALTSGKALKSQPLRELFTLRSDDFPMCFLSIGTATAAPKSSNRPQISDYVQTFRPPQ